MYTTLTEFLESTGAKLTLFDMGRRVIQIPRDRFLQFERTLSAYPLPLQRQAWFGLVYQHENRDHEAWIWFVRFPLDETGCLIQAARDDFIHRLLESLGENLATGNDSSQSMSQRLADNPYTFSPRDDRMAVFHARLSIVLKRPASKFYPHAQRYFSGALGWDQWPFLGYQGIADLAARQHQEHNLEIITTALPHLPPQPLEALCHCLENEPVGQRLTEALLQRLRGCLRQDPPDPSVITATLRGASYSTATELSMQMLREVLDGTRALQADTLAAVSARAWPMLENEQLGSRFLERLAESVEDQSQFDQILADLLFIPGMRDPLLRLLRNPNRSETLARAIGAMFRTLKPSASK